MKYTINNYEEHAIDFLDGTMSQDETDAFNEFLNLHPKIKSEFRDFERITLPEFTAKYPTRSNLLKEEPQRNRRIILIHIRRIAAAILVLLLVAFFWNKRNTNDIVTTEKAHSNKNEILLTSDTLAVVKEISEKSSEIVTASSNASSTKHVDKRLVETEIQKTKGAIAHEEATGLMEGSATTGPTDVEPEVQPVLEDLALVERPIHRVAREVSQIERIQTASIRPTFSGQIVPALPEEMILISGDIIEKEGPTKIGRLLAKISLIPEGLIEEFTASNLRESLLPEYYSEIK